MAAHAEGSDRAFVRSFTIVLGGLVLVAIACMILAAVISGSVGSYTQADRASMGKNLQPVATVVTNSQASAPEASAPEASAAAPQAQAASQPALGGEQVVAQVCSSCHATGLMSSPKIGDAAAWGERFKTQGGLDGLVQHAIHGLNMMPPRGGNPALTDQDIHNAVKYMLSKAGISG